ncbi:nuclear mRNA export, poly(A)+RNA binding protein [Gonapodya sp. JEL0774]|nr:nuclear mRNA export, poly(A)+RNA binding protein [Gonapodya sp. JEL0774]
MTVRARGGGALRRGGGSEGGSWRGGGGGGPRGRGGRGRGAGGAPNGAGSSGGILNRLGPRPADGAVVFESDRDGDLAMDSSVRGGARGGGANQHKKKGFDPYAGGRRRNAEAGTAPVVSAGPRNGGGFGPLLGEGAGQGGARKPGSVDVAVTGWSPSPEATRQQLIAFIRSRCTRNLNIAQVRTTDGGTTVVLTVANWAEASALQRMSGSAFKGNKLSFDLVESEKPAHGLPSKQPRGSTGAGAPSSAPNLDRIGVLRTYLKFQYSEQMQLLDLSGMATHPALREVLLNDLNNEKVGGVVCKMIGEEFPGIQSLALNSNRLNSLDPFRTLFQYTTRLVNLSLENNHLNSLGALEAIKNAPLRELRLRGNPVYDKDVARQSNYTGRAAVGHVVTTSRRFRENVLAMFPTLMILDEESIEEGAEDGDINIDVDQPGATAASGGVVGRDSVWPVPIKKGWVDSEGTAEVVEDFLSKFFPLFDNNRQELRVLYHANAVFSVAANSNVAPNRKPINRRSRITNQHADDMTNWQRDARNLLHLRGSNARLNTLACGPDAIIAALNKLPSTRHPSDSNRKVVDAWTQQDPTTGSVRLFVSVHSEFIEVQMNLSKSFDRLFVIVPAREGSDAQKAGSRFEILNDQLTVRPWSPNAWRNALEQGATPAAMSSMQPTQVALAQPELVSQGMVPVVGVLPTPYVQPVQPVVVPNVLVPPGMDPAEAARRKGELGLNDLQNAKVLALSTQTKLNYNYACQCLIETEWDFDRAVVAFSAVQAQLPPDAYLPLQ